MRAQDRTRSSDDEDEQQEPSTGPGLEDAGGASEGGGKPPPKQDESDFDDEPGKKTDDGSRVCPQCQAIFEPGVVACECGWTTQRKEMKRREEEGRQAASLLKITYVERFSDRGVRAKASDVERDFRHYFKRSLRVKSVFDSNGQVLQFPGVLDRMNRDPKFRDQMTERGYTLEHAKEMDRLGRENPDDRSQRKQPGFRTCQ